MTTFLFVVTALLSVFYVATNALVLFFASAKQEAWKAYAGGAIDFLLVNMAVYFVTIGAPKDMGELHRIFLWIVALAWAFFGTQNIARAHWATRRNAQHS